MAAHDTRGMRHADVDPPLTLAQVLAEEHARLTAGRAGGAAGASTPEIAARPDTEVDAVRAAMLRADYTALCLSGGGIRSAAFALGVVQGLATSGQLARVDYLSTVSGGGYLGAWLTAWMHREGAGGRPHAARPLGSGLGTGVRGRW